MTVSRVPMKSWVSAMRLRTLPLAFSCILAGSAVSLMEDQFSATILILALLTTLFLQILSNLANDLGDFLNGVDNEKRTGPARSVQSGTISASSMKRAVVLFAVLALISGLLLIYLAFGKEQTLKALLFLALGITAIAAALRYTMGVRPYGYRGLGDLFVFAFFGVVGVMGVAYLHAGMLSLNALWPALSIGFWSAAVLNLNNMRDIENDRNSGKITLVVRLGIERAKVYHFILIGAGCFSALTLAVTNSDQPFLWISLLPVVLFARHLKQVYGASSPTLFDPELKKVALSTFFYSLLIFLMAILT